MTCGIAIYICEITNGHLLCLTPWTAGNGGRCRSSHIRPTASSCGTLKLRQGLHPHVADQIGPNGWGKTYLSFGLGYNGLRFPRWTVPVAPFRPRNFQIQNDPSILYRYAGTIKSFTSAGLYSKAGTYLYVILKQCQPQLIKTPFPH